jgi:sulfur relay (sulfurtransferase) DsrF/TusC family protein
MNTQRKAAEVIRLYPTQNPKNFGQANLTALNKFVELFGEEQAAKMTLKELQQHVRGYIAKNTKETEE